MRILFSLKKTNWFNKNEKKEEKKRSRVMNREIQNLINIKFETICIFFFFLIYAHIDKCHKS